VLEILSALLAKALIALLEALVARLAFMLVRAAFNRRRQDPLAA
jgi:hypothetical protein